MLALATLLAQVLAADSTSEVAATEPLRSMSPPEALGIRTDPGTWTSTAWRDLRWGMGPCDVLDRLPGVTPGWLGLGQDEQARPRGILKVDLSDPELGSVDAYLRFREGRLTTVTVEPRPERRATGPDAVAEFEAMRAKFTARLGAPTCQTFLDGRQCTWSTPTGDTTLDLESSAVAVVFAPSSTSSRAVPSPSCRATPADLAVLATAPASWSRLGLAGVQLGMGLRDVGERLGGTCPGRHLSPLV